MLAFLLALDERVFQLLHEIDRFWPKFWELIAVYGVYLIPFILVWFWFARRRETALAAFLTGAIAWQGVNNLVSTFIHRVRPIDALNLSTTAQEGLFHRPGGSFPSDHTAFMTAVALSFWLAGERRVATLIFLLEAVIVVARVVVGFHWPGDIVAGIMVGVVTVGLLRFVHRPFDRWLILPLVHLARRLRL